MNPYNFSIVPIKIGSTTFNELATSSANVIFDEANECTIIVSYEIRTQQAVKNGMPNKPGQTIAGFVNIGNKVVEVTDLEPGKIIADIVEAINAESDIKIFLAN